ncbi:MAG: hypothetical protein WC662_01475 [Candidatus Paceibacterota bacterium]|jgi:hypothetical protein
MKGPEQNFFKKENNQELSPMIEALRIPAENLLKQMKYSINNGEFKTIIGDDASGRIPTLIINNVIKDIYKEKGYTEPQIMFIAGSRGLGEVSEKEVKIDKTKEHISKYLKNKEGKTLISTEYIQYGSSLKSLGEALKELKIPYEISTFCYFSFIRKDNSQYEDDIQFLIKQKENELGGKINYGKIIDREANEESLKVFYDRRDNQSNSTGVHKVKKEVLSKATHNVEDSDSKKIIKQKEKGRKNVNQAREEAKILSDQLTDWYRKNLEK